MANQNVYTHLTNAGEKSRLIKWHQQTHDTQVNLLATTLDTPVDGQGRFHIALANDTNKVWYYSDVVNSDPASAGNGTQWHEFTPATKKEVKFLAALPIDTWEKNAEVTGTAPTFTAGVDDDVSILMAIDGDGFMRQYSVTDPLGTPIITEVTEPIFSIIVNNTVTSVADVVALPPRPHSLYHNETTGQKFIVDELLNVVDISGQDQEVVLKVANAPIDSYDNGTLVAAGAITGITPDTKFVTWVDLSGKEHLYSVNRDGTGAVIGYTEITTNAIMEIDDNTLNSVADVQALSSLRYNTYLNNPDTGALFYVTEIGQVIQLSSAQKSGSLVFNTVSLVAGTPHVFDVNDDASISYQDEDGFHAGTNEEALHTYLLTNGLEIHDASNNQQINTEGWAVIPISTTTFSVTSNFDVDINAALHCEVKKVIAAAPAPFGNLIYPSPTFVAEMNTGNQAFTPLVIPSPTATYTATGLPTWATIDSATGVITVNTVGTNQPLVSIVVTATDGGNTTTANVDLGIETYLLQVNAAPGPDDELGGAPIQANVLAYFNAMGGNSVVASDDLMGGALDYKTGNITKLVLNSTPMWAAGGMTMEFAYIAFYGTALVEIDFTSDYMMGLKYGIQTSNFYVPNLAILKMKSTDIENGGIGNYFLTLTGVSLPKSVHTLSLKDSQISQVQMDAYATEFLTNTTLTEWDSSGCQDGSATPIEPSAALKADLIANVATTTF